MSNKGSLSTVQRHLPRTPQTDNHPRQTQAGIDGSAFKTSSVSGFAIYTSTQTEHPLSFVTPVVKTAPTKKSGLLQLELPLTGTSAIDPVE